MEFIIRSGYESNTYLHEDRDEELFIYVPISYAWQEGPNDLHVHFFTKDEPHTEPHQPEYDENTGDYILPDPRTVDGFVRCYHMAFVRKPKSGPAFIANDRYVDLLMEHWYSPCSGTGTSKKMNEYLSYRQTNPTLTKKKSAL